MTISTHTRNVIIQFITGGLIVSGTSYLAQYVSPTIASIFWSFPFSLFPIIIFMWLGNTNIGKIREFALSEIFGMGLLLIFIISLIISLYLLPKHNAPLYALGIAVSIWSVCAYLVWKFNLGIIFSKLLKHQVLKL